MSNNIARTLDSNIPGLNVDALLQLARTQLPGIVVGAVLTTQILTKIVDIIKNNLSAIVGTVLTTAGLTALIPSIAVVVVNGLGFTTGGVAAGSIAAAVQSILYGGATGGVFSGLQAFGATATVASPAVLALGGLALGAGALWLSRGLGNGGDDERSNQGSRNFPRGINDLSRRAMVRVRRF